MESEPLSILLVEDEEDHAELVRRAFGEAPRADRVRLRVAASLAEARACQSECAPDLIIADWILPDGRGTDLLPADGQEDALPVVIMTSHGDEQVAVEAMKAGALDYVVKTPATLAEMPHTVQRVLREWGHINQRRGMEEALRESEERYRSLFDNVPVGLYRSGADGELHDANPAMVHMLGYPDRESFLAVNAASTYVNPQDRGRWQAIMGEEGVVRDFETELRRHDGSIIWVRISARAIRDNGSQVMYYEGAMEDITEHKRAEEALRESKFHLEETLTELKTTQRRVLQQERLAAVGQLAAGIAHDFNNLLTSIIGFAELLRMDPNVPYTMQADLARIVQQGQRGAHLVRQILDFSRQSIRQPQPMNLVSFVKEASRLLERTIPETIHILVEVDSDEIPIKADPTQLQQMLTNLAVNARDAMPAGGELRLRLSRFTLKPGQESPYPDLPLGEWGVLSVSDTGTGVPQAIVSRIFEPFFTTKGPGRGAGLGLAQVYGIVKQQDGFIDVTSQGEQGTTFTIYLPLRITEPLPRMRVPRDIPRGSGQTILLVEDEPEVLVVTQAMLERLGYRVLTAVDGQAALERYEAHADEISLVLSDVVMPKMDGLAMVRALKAENPAIRVVLITGYPSQQGEWARDFMAQDVVDWLQKPLSLAQLAQTVSGALQPSS